MSEDCLFRTVLHSRIIGWTLENRLSDKKSTENHWKTAGLPRSSSMGMIHEARDEMLYEVPDTEEALRRGEYTVIRSLVRVLEVSIYVGDTLYSIRICR